jgi:hypothetical protein
MEKLDELLAGKGDNYILPFFWQHGEDEAKLREYMGAIYKSGIGAVCLEARPHVDFCGPKWWQDVDVIMDEARKRSMKVWILDDAHFPTGYANGALLDAKPELCKQYLFMQYTDFYGHLPNITLNVRALMLDAPPAKVEEPLAKRIFDDDKIIGVIASHLTCGNDVDETLLDLTDKIKGDWLYWDNPPEAMWRIYVIFTTRNKGGRTDYINMLDYDSCKLMIDHVYEKHFEHYGKDFGETLAGFFSDEPALGNHTGLHDYSESIGRKRMPLPWNKDMPKRMHDALGSEWARYLPALWYQAGSDALVAKVRYAYMDAMTRLIELNFSGQLGRWCEKHGVLYIGHIIEDNNQDTKLAASMGHFFRSMNGQHMSGIDVIGNQILIGGENHFRFRQLDNGFDGEFFHFALAKLGSSHAHIDPKKKGRAMCEVFGGYGWGEGTRLMKYLVDHLIVRGINYVVPHSFNPKKFPDTDSPPHLYAHGKNPLYRHFGKLMGYMNRLCHLFNGGRHVSDVAVLYHAEAEWTGDYMRSQKPARVLAENQIDFDILPSDVFMDTEYYNSELDGKLVVNGERYMALIIPYAEFITLGMARFIRQNINRFPIVFINALPKGISNPRDSAEIEGLMRAIRICPVTDLENLTDFVEASNAHSIHVTPGFKDMRFMHYVSDTGLFEYYMFSNEAGVAVFDGYVDLPTFGSPVIYDAMENVLRPIKNDTVGNGSRVYLRLEPYESAIVCFGLDIRQRQVELILNPVSTGCIHELSGPWSVSVVEAPAYPNFRPVGSYTELHDMGLELPDFSGFIRYETSFFADGENPGKAFLEFEDAFEGVEIWVNGAAGGMKICPPYRFDISGLLKNGENIIRVEVANTLDRQVRSILGHSLGPKIRRSGIIEPSGLIGKAVIRLCS